MSFANIEKSESAGNRALWTKFIPVALVAAIAVFGSTLAANINLGSSSSLEFGQGIQSTTACSGTTALKITPQSKFVNAQGSGAFYFKSVTVSNIPLGCQGSDFVLNAYGETSAVALSIFDISAKGAIVYHSSSGPQVGAGMLGMTVSGGSDSFTVSFTNPVAMADTVYRITIQSGAHATNASEVCGSNGLRASGGACRVGDTGSGGGTIFYVSASPFTASGSLCNTNCYYLEFAPKGWASISDYPNNITANGQIFSARSGVNEDPTLVWTDGNFANNARSTVAVGTAIGTGYINTQQIKNNTPLGVHDERFAFIAALAYIGNSGSSTVGQWHLPSLLELNEMCKFVRGQTSDLGDTNIECSKTGTTLNTSYGFSGSALYMSSTYGLQADGQVDGYFLDTNANPMRNLYYANYGNKFRPVRVS
jgi:hypothetical protein